MKWWDHLDLELDTDAAATIPTTKNTNIYELLSLLLFAVKYSLFFFLEAYAAMERVDCYGNV